MINIILCGPPGCGKGTQAFNITHKYGLIHISTGDLFRREKKNHSPIWQEVQSYIDRGELAPDSITFRLLKAEMDKTPEATGYLFDGFPRNTNQAILLDEFLSDQQMSVTQLIEIKVPDQEIVKRILHRGKTSGRSDDQDESIIQNRINVYIRETQPVASHYAAKGISSEIDGLGTIDEIFGRLQEVLDTFAAV